MSNDCFSHRTKMLKARNLVSRFLASQSYTAYWFILSYFDEDVAGLRISMHDLPAPHNDTKKAMYAIEPWPFLIEQPEGIDQCVLIKDIERLSEEFLDELIKHLESRVGPSITEKT